MAAVQDEIAGGIGEQTIGLQLDPATSLSPRAFGFVDLLVDVSALLPAGIVLPVELTVSPAANLKNYQRRYFRKYLPSVVTIRVLDSGSHTVRLAEVGHMRAYGELTFIVK